MIEIARAESVYGSYGKYYIVGLSYEVLSQSAVTNSSTVKKQLWLEALQYGNASWSSGSATIDGNTSALNVFSISPYQRIILKEETVTVKHNSDGKKSIGISGSYTTAPGLHGSVSGTINLPDIKLGSTVACPDADVGSATTIGIQSFVQDVVHTITYNFKGLTGYIANNSKQNPIVWKIPETFYEKMPNSKREECELICTTNKVEINGATIKYTQIGSPTTYKFHVTVNEQDNKPDVEATIVDMNEKMLELTGTNNKLVKYFSCPKITVNATPKNSATIKSYRVECGDGKFGIGQEVTLSNIESGSFKVIVTDSRDIQTIQEVSANMIDYIKLGLKNCLFVREVPTSNYVVLNVEGIYYNNIFSETNSNTLTVKYRYKEVYNEWSDYVTVAPTIEGNTFKITNLKLGTEELNFDYRKDFKFELLVQDKIYDASSEDLTIKSSEQDVLKGIPTYDAGEHDLNVNGALTVSDIEGNNTQNVVLDNDPRLTRAIAELWIPHQTRMTWSSNWSDQIVPFTQLGNQIGNKFTFNSEKHGFNIPKGISKVKVFVNFNWYNVELASDTDIKVCKNNEMTSIAYIFGQKESVYYIQAIGEIILDVTENDVIYLVVNKHLVGSCMIFGQTKMIIEEIG